ncbi:MAG: ATP synthase F1 subunit gamma [Candidatus Midichloria sp.]|nr:MAG: ATP synthase F1 subunit gamma [Candidatus Midichloria sp.]
MSSLKFLKGQIKSVKSTQKITRAMQLISVARLNKAREALELSIPYTTAMKKMIAAVAGSGNLNIPMFKRSSGEQQHLVVVVTSDRGLCGSFNAAVIKKAKEYCTTLQTLNESFYIRCIGKRGYESLSNYLGTGLVTKVPAARQIDTKLANSIAKNIVKDLSLNKFNAVNIIFNNFISVMQYETINEQVIPCEVEANNQGTSFEFEPVLTGMIEELIEKYLIAVIYNVLLENAASEHSARMTAMDNATRNAKKMLHNLSHKYNRIRQALITKELIEIISGAQAI